MLKPERQWQRTSTLDWSQHIDHRAFGVPIPEDVRSRVERALQFDERLAVLYYHFIDCYKLICSAVESLDATSKKNGMQSRSP